MARALASAGAPARALLSTVSLSGLAPAQQAAMEQLVAGVGLPVVGSQASPADALALASNKLRWAFAGNY